MSDRSATSADRREGELARLARENAELRAEVRELRRFVRLADGCAQAVAEGCDSLTKVR